MKTNPLLILLAVTGATFALAAPTLRAQAGRTDTSGNLLTPLNLGSPKFTGTLSPVHLGTGTPSAATVLRGDGTWAATTPTGATLAATGNLLMGDGAGNAVGVSAGSDLLRVLQARLQTVVAAQTPPPNLLSPVVANGYGLTSGTVNADGTVTVPANGAVHWTVPDTGLAYYLYAAATAEVAPGALTLRASQAVSYDKTASTGTLLPGVIRSVTIPLTSGYGSYSIDLANTTASPLTVFYPVMSTTDNGLTLLASYKDQTAVATQPVADLDFTRFASEDRSGRYQFEKLTTLAADSVNGNDASAGTLYAPKVTLQQTLSNGSVFGLYRGSLFRDSLPLSALSTTHGVVVQDVALGSVKALPIISGLALVNNAGIVGNGDGTYSIQWTPADSAVANDGYSNVFVVEINTLTEAVSPIASRRRMIDVTSNALVASTPGSVYVTSFGNGWLGRIHPSDGLAPGSGAYRYEVVSRLQPANWNAPANLGDGAMSGVELVCGSSGYGALGGPAGFVGDRLAFIHATTHNAVIGGGSLQRSLFYESGQTTGGSGNQGIQLAWYAATGTGLRWDLRHCLFYMNVGDRYANGLIAHTSGSSTFDRGDISDCAFLGARWSNGSLQGTAIDYENVAAGTISRVYVQDIDEVFGFSMPGSTEVKNSVFRAVHSFRVAGNSHDNLVALESGSDPNNVNNTYSGACTFQQSGASATNNLIWVKGIVAAGVANNANTGGINFYAPSLTGCTFARNIVVFNPGDASTTSYMSQVTNPGSMSIDHNLVVNLGKGGISAQGPGAGYAGWAAYQAGYATFGYDQHSLYVDLSNDPRGLNAVFANPANGDFRWAQTDVARQCAAYCRANGVGPAAVTSRWPLVPAVDDALRLLTDL